ncbi:hypothetical protein BH09SUM1_BH09SUM1_03380 [soil metagenome]
MLSILGKLRAKSLMKKSGGRRIRIHSVTPVKADFSGREFSRVAFEFLDPPGPWSMQFFESSSVSASLAGVIAPGALAKFFESDDAARTRVMAAEGGQVIWQR